MERVKDISKLKLGAGYVLLKMHFKNSTILAPGSMSKDNAQLSYAEVIEVGPTVIDLEVGDIALDFTTKEGFEWKGDKYTIIARMSIKVATSRDNFKNKVDYGKQAELKN